MNSVNKYIIRDNINLYVIDDKKYKTVYSCAYIHRKLSRLEATLNSLLSKVLKTSTQKHTSMNALNAYAEHLYGCIFDVGVSKRANIQSIVSTVNTVSDKYTMDNTQEKALELMLDLLFRPHICDESFNVEYVNSQKNNLRDDIEGLINDKRSYSNVRCLEEMCKGEPNSVVEIGYCEDIDSIDAKSLYDHYKSIIHSSPVDIFVVGDVDSSAILEFLKGYFSAFDFSINPINIECSTGSAGEPKYVEDNMDVNQGKLVMGLRSEINIESPLYYALLVGNSIFGSGAHSRLFNNVREKLSLCYYAYSRLDKYNAIMLVGSGIEFENYEKTKDAVLLELENIRSGDFSDSELDVAKEYIISSYKSYEDSPGYLVDYYLGLSFSDNYPGLDKAREAIYEVSREDVLKAFDKVKLDTVYFLNGKEEKK